MLSSYNITIRVSFGYFIFTRHLLSIHEFLFNAWHPVLNNYVIELCPGLSAIDEYRPKNAARVCIRDFEEGPA